MKNEEKENPALERYPTVATSECVSELTFSPNDFDSNNPFLETTPPPRASLILANNFAASASLLSQGSSQNSYTHASHLTSNDQLLRFDALKGRVYGREPERTLLRTCFRRTVEQQSRELVLLHGVSGSGKTYLAAATLEEEQQQEELQKLLQEKEDEEKQDKEEQKEQQQEQQSFDTNNYRGIFCMGKFDQHNQEPYAAIADAMRGICGKLLTLKNKEQSAKKDGDTTEIQNTLIQNIGLEQIQLLATIVPELSEILDEGTTTAASISTTYNIPQTQNPPPETDPIFNHPSPTSVPSSSSLGSTAVAMGKEMEQAAARLKHAFRTFFRQISQLLSPLVMVLDDCQWCDVMSLELLDNILTDRDNKAGLLVLCLYRDDDEINEYENTNQNYHHNSDAEQQQQQQQPSEQRFQKAAEMMEEKKEKSQFQITEITLGSLTIECVTEILKDLLLSRRTNQENHGGDDDSVDDDYLASIAELAELCHRRTLGNAFFLMTFIRRLRDDGLFLLDPHTQTWSWDQRLIMEKTAATTNVVELMKDELQRLPPSYHAGLVKVACIGDSFKPDVLDVIWDLDIYNDEPVPRRDDRATYDGHTKFEGVESNRRDWICEIERKGFIEEYDCMEGQVEVAYRWIHDKVREAALSLVPLETLWALKGRLGEELLAKLKPDASSSMVFVVANLLHGGYAPTDQTTKIEHAKIYLEAAKKASSISAFVSTANFCGWGIDMLSDDRWERYYQLTLELNTVAAEAEVAIGRTEVVLLRFQEITAQENRPITDKLRVYSAMVRRLAGLGMTDDAVDQILYVLQELGIAFPRSKAGRILSLVSKLKKVKTKVERLDLTTVKELAEMTDPNDQCIMKLLSQLGTYAYRNKRDRLLMPLAILKSVEFSLARGSSEYGPVSFALLGLLFSGIRNDVQIGNKMANISMELLNAKAYTSVKPRTTFLVWCFNRCWLHPLSDIIQPVSCCYSDGLTCGDVESAMLSIWQCIVIGFETGRPLDELEDECYSYIAQMFEYNLIVPAGLTTIYLLCFVKLIGGRTDCPFLEDVAPNLEVDELIASFDGDKTNIATAKAMQCRLCAILGEHEEGSQLALKVGNSYSKTNPSHFSIMPETFSRGICLYSVARSTKKRKYKKAARKVHTTIRKWKKDGNPNVVHYDSLLNAEKAILAGKHDLAEKCFQSSRDAASQRGFKVDAALATERYGEFLVHHYPGREQEGIRVFDSASQMYEEIGADTKVHQMALKYKDMRPRPSEIAMPSGSITTATSNR